jgi:esterase/lipase superfamily enzyme
MYVTDRAQIKFPNSKFVAFGAGAADDRSIRVGTVRVDLNWGRACAASDKPRTWIHDGEKLEDAMLESTSVGFIESNGSKVHDIVHEYRAAIKKGEKVHALIFVHGFRVTFDEAAATAAELANCMKSDLLPVVVSWPSAGVMTSYLADEESVSASTERLRSVFQALLTDPDIDEVTIIAHSMGTRLVTRILADLDLQNVKLPHLAHIVFAAADLSQQEFSAYWARIHTTPSKGWTLYASSEDLALWASTVAHRTHPRIGDVLPNIFTVQGADTIDASTVAPVLKAFGHSYIVNSEPVVQDMRTWIVDHKDPAKRGLRRHAYKPADYWDLLTTKPSSPPK